MKKTTTPTRERRGPDALPSHVDPQDFARRLHALMLERGFTQSTLAKEAFGERKDHRGIVIPAKRDQISAYVTGKRLPNAENLMQLAKALGVKMSDLVPDVERAPVDKNQLPWQATPQPDGKIFITVSYAFEPKAAAQIIDIVMKASAAAAHPHVKA